MAELDPALAAALLAARPLLFGTVEIVLPDHTLRLLDGAGEVPIDGEVFAGRDDVFGVLDTIKGLSDVSGNSAPAITIGLIPPNSTGLSTLLDPAVQGSPVTISMGVLDPETGLPIGERYLIMVAEIDVPKVDWGPNDRRLELKCGTVADRFFAIEEGKRLSDSFHQLLWPGELGCGFVTNVEAWVPWGQKIDLTAVQTRTNLPSMGGHTFERT